MLPFGHSFGWMDTFKHQSTGFLCITCEYFPVSCLRQLLMEHVIENEMVGSGKSMLPFVPDDVLCSFKCHSSASGSWIVLSESKVRITSLHLHEENPTNVLSVNSAIYRKFLKKLVNCFQFFDFSNACPSFHLKWVSTL